MNSFQTIVLGIFGIFIVIGLLAVALTKQQAGQETVSLSLWGSLDKKVIDEVLDRAVNSDTLKVTYREISANWLDHELIEALAVRQGPDLLLLPLPLLARYKDKLRLISYSTYTERLFKDIFIQEGDLFLSSQGIFALPFSIDPLVMYYNRDFLDEIGVAEPPRFWDEFISLARDLTLRDEYGNISRSAVALGEYRNVNHAREILAALFMQSGAPITSVGTAGSRAALDKRGASSVLDFYTEFANPLKPVYSWNRSLPSAREMFLSSRLGVYFGFGSEYAELRKGNPNLDFDVASFPRPRDASVSTTYGTLTGAAILRTSLNPAVALQVALTLSGTRASQLYSAQTKLPPVQRSLLSKKPTDAFGAIMYDAAIRARGFIDPNPAVSAGIFRTLVESVTSGRAKSKDAVRDAERALQAAF